MHKNKHNNKEKTLCSLDLGWIYLFCHRQRQATCVTGCRGLHLTSWDWDMPPHFGIGWCKQTPWIVPGQRRRRKGGGTHEWQWDISLLQLRFSLSLFAKARAAAASRGSTRKKNTSSPLRSEVSLSEGTEPRRWN